MKRAIAGILVVLSTQHGLGCGLLGTGTFCSTTAAPTGGIQAYTGEFSGRNGKTVSGTALVYRVAGEVVLRLESITVPAETGLRVVLASAAGDVFSATMNASCGSINFATGQNFTQILASVRIESTRITLNNIYGVALLTALTTGP